MICRQCGHENPETNKFCGECAAPEGAGAPRGGGTQGRHRAVLRPGRVHRHVGVGRSRGRGHDAGAYFAMARAQIESHGGVVEKFIGDAVVGRVRGARRRTRTIPSVRFVPGFGSSRTPRSWRRSAARRCACASASTRARRSCGWASRPGSGEGFLTGDAINTASRLQSVAPEMGVAVGLATYEATAGGLRLRGAGARDAEGEGRAGAGVPPDWLREPGSAPISRVRTTRRSSAARSTSRC